jgi:hypothetical protein
MEALSLAALGYVIKSIKNSKGGKQATDDLSSAIWNWIRPVFVIDDKEIVADFEDDPDDQDIQTEFQLKLKRKIKKEPDFAEKLSQLVEQAQSVSGNITGATINQNNTYGDNIGRDKINYSNDQSKKPQR